MAGYFLRTARSDAGQIVVGIVGSNSGITFGGFGGPQPRNPLDQAPGLGGAPRSRWPRVQVQEFQKPIDMLKPGSRIHNHTMDYLLKRLWDAERSMTKFHPRWRVNEMRNQAWIDLNKFDRVMRDANESGKPPKAVDIVIPYQFSTLSTLATYMMQVFAGRQPFLNVGTYGANVENAMKLEIVLQYQLDHNRALRWWWHWFNDMGLYGVGILINKWRVKTGLRTSPASYPVLDVMTGQWTQETIREQRERVIYEGNEIFSQDPFMFYPDPRVPMVDVASRGEYVFWRNFEGKHTLKRLEEKGVYRWIDATPETVADKAEGQLLSARHLLTGGDPHAGGPWDWQIVTGPGSYQVDTCSIDIVPRELGLGESERVQKWIFTVVNRSQIVSAAPQIEDHGEHPVIVAEPFGAGYDFGSAGMADYVGPLQDSMSWFLNSHMENVRSAINNQFVVDPFAVEMKDVNRPGPGKTIRMKRSAINRDVRTAIQQLPVADVTRGHIDSMDTFFEIGQRVSAISENLQGIQDSGGRKTATEVRTATEAGVSRLAALARVISSQGMTALTNQMSLNTQQFMTTEFYVRVVGPEGLMHPINISPDAIAGDFYYPINDGTLPSDKVALLDIWQQMLVGVLQDPELRATYSVPKIFEFVAELGGAKNIKSFRLQVQDQAQIQQGAQQGNLAPIPGATGPSGLVNATLPQPGNRVTRQAA